MSSLGHQEGILVLTGSVISCHALPPQSASATTWAPCGRTARAQRAAGARQPQGSAGASPTWWGRPATAVPRTHGGWPAAPGASSVAVTLRAPSGLPATR